MDRKVLCIVNPISGKGGRKRRIVKMLQAHGYDVCYTGYAGHAEEIARATDADVVVAVGGDGTVNEVARALIGSDKVLGIIPCGSGDGLALHLGISRNPRRAVKVLEKGSVEPLDCATVDGKPFFSVCGVGLDAIVSERFAKSGRRGLATYIEEAVKTWKGFEPAGYRLVLDGKDLDCKAVLITVGNSNQWGNGARVTPLAKTNDGELDVTVVDMFRTVEIPSLALMLMTGVFDRNRRVHCYQAKEIEIIRPDAGPAHCDGDYIAAGRRVSVSLLPHRIKVLVP